MPRDARAYLADVVDACEAIAAAVESMDLEAYSRDRLIRSSVEREFIIIGDGLAALSRIASSAFAHITQARRIIDFCNQLTHEYPAVDDAIVWAIIGRDVPRLRRECDDLLQRQVPPDLTAGGEARR